MTVHAFRGLTLEKSRPTWVFYEGEPVQAQAEGQFIECERPAEVWP